MGGLEGRCSLPSLVRSRSTCGTLLETDLGRMVVVMRMMMRMRIVEIMVILLWIALFGKVSEVGGNHRGDNNIDVDAGEN